MSGDDGFQIRQFSYDDAGRRHIGAYSLTVNDPDYIPFLIRVLAIEARYAGVEIDWEDVSNPIGGPSNEERGADGEQGGGDDGE